MNSEQAANRAIVAVTVTICVCLLVCAIGGTLYALGLRF